MILLLNTVSKNPDWEISGYTTVLDEFWGRTILYLLFSFCFWLLFQSF